MVKLSIIILSFNTEKLTKECIYSLLRSLGRTPQLKAEIIVVDNASSDGSIPMLKSLQGSRSAKSRIKIFLNRKNVGFPAGNNQAVKRAEGEYILFLNSDVVIEDVDFAKVISYLDTHPKTGVLTVKMNLPHGGIDPASHRGFPTLWNAFCYFLKLEEVFKGTPFLNKLFGGYHLIHLDLKVVHAIDSPSGAFYLTRRSLFKKLKGFDESFFMYGEDLDLSYRIKKLGYNIIYYPHYSVTHFKYASGLEAETSDTRANTKRYFYEAMKIFYRKHYEKSNPEILNKIVYIIIDFLKNNYE
ncbi:glycosyltransferase family 2 protein [Candidatus Roizmanbacteria bacterium]|nr:glycosyltransferase family 2 protein [Candidatus Roizmanbacteria bacterium]